ncbi:hypothetical protein ACJIZ3_022434 [Penstemon smallii]|uniref:Uncharacterized protein n=1 Tax=Penstemon smallii TaxID=265156 RepID=A0ABD3TP53_9LAMI
MEVVNFKVFVLRFLLIHYVIVNFIDHTGANNNSRNRKMKEIAVDTNNDLFNLQPQQHLPSPDVTQVQCILNTFMSLITAPSPKDDLDSDIKNQTEHMNQIITYHSENLKHTLTRVLENQHRERYLEADGRAAKKLKEMELEIYAKHTRNAELENLLEFYKGEVARLQGRVRILERSAVSLRKRLREVNVARERRGGC